MKKYEKYKFDGWFELEIPENWECKVESELLSINSLNDPKGVLQISFYKIKEKSEELSDFTSNHLRKFIEQYEINIEQNTFKTLENQFYTVTTVNGNDNENFIKIWVIANNKKMLITTYISSIKSNELSTVEDIVYSLNFEI